MRGWILATAWTVLLLVTMTASQNCSGVFTTYVVVDGSASISSENFRRVKDALKIYINGSISTNSAVKIGVVVYSDSVTQVIRASSNITSLNNDVDDIVHPQSGTATNLGIDRAKELLLTDPSNNPMVMIVITDGLSQQGDLTINSSQEARDVGIAMIAVGVTGVFNAFPSIKQRFEAELLGIAGSNETVILVRDFSDLVNDMINISRRICRVVVLIQQQLEDRTVLAGSSPVFRTTLSQADIRTGTWTWQGRDLTTDNRYNKDVQSFVQTLTIPNVQRSQSGNYTYTVGTIPTTATLTVLDLLTDVTVGAGGTATFRTTVSPSSAGFWSKDGNRISASSKYIITGNGENRELRITGVEMSDQGRYSYTVNGVSTVATLTVEAVLVNGGYTLWGPWIDTTSCGATCGINALKSTTRTRTCTNPTPANGGNDCQLLGPSSETTTVDCGQSIRCAVDGGVGQWGAWSSVVCPVTCGFSPDGARTRSRLCDSPEPSGGGRDCTDSLVERETRPCNAGQCPIDGGISPWTSWGPAVCNVTCGVNIIGVSTRERLCNRPIPSLGGKNCTESRSETISARCILPPCPVDGNWGGWTAWSSRVCDQSCGLNVNGRETRTRECDNPRPTADGETCPGLREETQTVVCPDVPCPVDGNWGAWTAWVGECDQTCGTNIIGRESRTRLCNNPPPSSADRTCPGDSEERRTISCPDNTCPVDGVWGAWQAWNFACNGASCGNYTGAKSRLRECNSPPPSGTGRFCPGEDLETSMHTCIGPPCSVDGGEGTWQEWTIIRNCLQTCGSNVFYIRQRLRACDNPPPQSGGADCRLTLNETQTLNCGFSECPIHGGWSPWGQWTPPNCQSWSCGDRDGPSVRTRTCTNPNPQYGGLTCSGSADETSLRPCGLPPCPINGTWNPWSAWVTTGQCSVTCGGGSQPYTRSRVCNQPQFDGQPCQGSTNDATTRVCNTNDCPVDGTWNPWNAWTSAGQCNVTCGGGSQPYTRSRVCNQPEFGGQPCQGSGFDVTTRVCNTNGCPIDGVWQTWSPWVQNGLCNVTCGGGYQPYTRSRLCTQPQFSGQPCQGSGSDATTRVCNTNNCPTDGFWRDWSPWVPNGQCNVTCGGGYQQYTRSRLCIQPQFGGQPCQGSANDATARVCNTNGCPIDGVWRDWSPWAENGQCSATCGGGIQPYIRTRLCDQPQNGGQPCQGNSDQVINRDCNVNRCPIDGQWREWSAWFPTAQCSVTCGGGNQPFSRSRVCIQPQFGGQPCQGSANVVTTRVCNTNNCPVNGEWREWTPWVQLGQCNVTCGGGYQTYTRSRECIQPQFGGQSCQGSANDATTRVCNTNNCPIDGEWREWSPWVATRPCNVTCGGGYQPYTRFRVCIQAQFGGQQCQGSANDATTRVCNTNNCPVDGVWREWSPWVPNGQCNVTCGGGYQPYTRSRVCIQPQFDGQQCQGSANDATTRVCNTNNCPIDGVWREWNPWVATRQCNVTCGGGYQPYTRFRVCIPPQFNGQQCQGSSNDATTRDCNTNNCPIDGEWREWSPWVSNAPCSVTCGGGNQPYTRSRVCDQPQFGGNQCQGSANDATTRDCNTNNCPVDGEWRDWSSWVATRECNVTCGGGYQPYARSRVCIQPTFGGQPCQGSANDATIRVCNTNNCPINGEWRAWTPWEETRQCNVTCGGGYQQYTRFRVCIQPQFGGQPCQGSTDDIDIRVCNTNNCPIDGEWRDWSPWVATRQCNVTCGGGYQPFTRSRVCNQPQFGGNQCQGSANDAITRVCNTNNCPIDGEWQEWTPWYSARQCNVTCGGGYELYRRSRACSQPQFGGQQCQGIANDATTRVCNTNNCPTDGEWQEWTPWISTRQCNVTCGGGYELNSRSRVCNPPTFGGKQCQGSANDATTRVCNTNNCPVDGVWRDWGPWGPNGQCNVTCGGGNQPYIRSRVCIQPQFGGQPCVGSGTDVTTRVCSTNNCPIDGIWGEWSQWLPSRQCNVTCGGGNQPYTRSRACLQPQFGGQPCQGSAIDATTRVCNTNNCPIDGVLRDWSPWGATRECNVTCGGGYQPYTRSRVCIQPTFGGQPCQGSTVDTTTRVCNTNVCPINGVWTNWSPWVPNRQCNVTCGGGFQPYIRSRVCNQPQFGGQPCQGNSDEETIRVCNINSCPINGEWREWSQWAPNGLCNVTCGGGYQRYSRFRVCNQPQFGGQQCQGSNVNSTARVCNTNNCPTDGVWREWSPWLPNGQCSVTCGGADGVWREWSQWVTSGQCNVTCGGGYQPYTRSRVCIQPTFGGQPCQGSANAATTRVCNNNNCPIDGVWREWSPWVPTRQCSVTCGGGFQPYIRSRVCIQSQFGGQPCQGNSDETNTRACNTNACAIDGVWREWNPWVATQQCNVTCGGGNQPYIRSRVCIQPQFGGQPCQGSGSDATTRVCNTNICPINGEWREWSQWAATRQCNVTCGGGVQPYIRSRVCIQPQFGGQQCQGSAFDTTTRVCNTNQCPIDGVWREWNPWVATQQCNVTCGGGYQPFTRSRVCNQPTFGGQSCQGSANDAATRVCNTNACPIDGVWREWAEWSPTGQCNVTCGGGFEPYRRIRICIEPQFNGRLCQGTSTEVTNRGCNSNTCPIHGGVTTWSPWSEGNCSVTCGNGTLQARRERTCTNPIPVFPGEFCSEDLDEQETRICTRSPCPINGGFSSWTQWSISPCPATCGSNILRTGNRSRTCSNPAPAYGGLNCSGNYVEQTVRTCIVPGCPVDGVWSIWNSWSPGTCPATCGRNVRKFVFRTRACNNPPQANGGLACPGVSYQTEFQNCGFSECPINGQWSTWNNWIGVPCRATCGSENTNAARTRSCTDPPPSFGGQGCFGPQAENRVQSCNLPDCPVDGGPGTWSQWSSLSCPQSCGNVTSTVFRNRPCNRPPPSNNGKFCNLTDLGESTIRNCNLPPCPIDGRWTDWTPWNIPLCSVSCGGATRTRTRRRSCTNPVPQNGGNTCVGSPDESVVESCNTDPCPIHGSWSQWTSWTTTTSCLVTCGPAVTNVLSRTRQCNNPRPEFGGDICFGFTTESSVQSCNLPNCPIDGGVSSWSPWSTPDCQETCGPAVMGRVNRTRRCDNPQPRYDGKDCAGPLLETSLKSCLLGGCPVNGGWSTWGPWAEQPCPATCGTSVTKDVVRRRTCDSPVPVFGGLTCAGSANETFSVNCNLPHCTGDIAGICREVENFGGVGYRSHPEDCDKYVQCYFNTTNDVVAIFRSCPFGHYWDQQTLRCDHFWKIICQQEKCNNDCAPTYDMDGSCRAYWACENGKSEAQCCSLGYRFIPGRGCMPDPNCQDPCPPPCLNTMEACDKRPEWTNKQSFNIRAGSIGWMPGNCGSGRMYDIVQCECVPNQPSGCSLSTQLNLQTQSFGSWIVDNVTVSGGYGRFSGNGKATYPLAMNQQSPGSAITLRFRYRENGVINNRQVLATSNECPGCANASTILITLERNRLNVDLTTYMGGVVRVPISTEGFFPNSWKDVAILYKETTLTVIVKSDSYEYIHQEWAPQVEILNCGIVFGSDSSATANFSGDLAYVNYYPCEPSDLY